MNAIDKMITTLMPVWIRGDKQATKAVLASLTPEEKIEILRPVLDCFKMPKHPTQNPRNLTP